MITFLKLMFTVAFGILQTLMGGLVLSKLWGWFISSRFDEYGVSKFGGVRPLSYLDCVGLMIVINFCILSTTITSSMNRIMDKEKLKEEDTLTNAIAKSLAMIVIVYPLALLSGYIWHLVIG